MASRRARRLAGLGAAALRDGRSRRGASTAPWSHQVEAAELAHARQDVVVATGTASGKSLAYQLPALTALADDPPRLRALPGADQGAGRRPARFAGPLELPGLRPAAYDGDTPMDERDWVRAHASWVLTNPDMLHRGMLPAHERWARVLRRLRLRGRRRVPRLPRGVRLARRARAAPAAADWPGCTARSRCSCCASATVADPAGRRHGWSARPVAAVTEDGAPRPGADFVLWEPRRVPGSQRRARRAGAPVRAGRGGPDAGRSGGRGARTLAFVRSRRGAEQTALTARRRLAETPPELVDRVAAYRGGYLPEERRELERALDSGELLGVATTNALELGIDIAGLDAVVLAGYPGTLASMWQQAGRAGRARTRRRALVVFVARDDPLDTYLVHHPEAVFGRPVEAAVTDPANPYILGPHLACAAAELQLTEADLPLFGGPPVEPVLAGPGRAAGAAAPAGRLVLGRARAPAATSTCAAAAAGRWRSSRRTPAGCWAPSTSRRAPAAVHAGAVYLHRGETYVVDELDLRRRRRAGPRGAARSGRRSPGRCRRCRSCSMSHRRIAERVPGGVRVGHRPGRRDQAGGGLPAPAAGRRGARRDRAGPAAAHLRTRARLVHRRPGGAVRRRRRRGRGARRAARRRARRDRPAAAVRRLRPLGHRRPVDRPAPRHRGADGDRLRRLSRAVPASPTAATRCWPTGCGGAGRRRRLRRARPAARPACSRPSAATATTRWTRPARCIVLETVLGALAPMELLANV